MFALPFVGGLAFYAIMNGPLYSHAIWDFIGFSIIGLLVCGVIISHSVTNRAFFGIPVPERDVEGYWNAISNEYARLSAILGLVLPAVPGLAIAPLTALGILEPGSVVAKTLAATAIAAAFGLVVWLSVKAFKRYAPDRIPPSRGAATR